MTQDGVDSGSQLDRISGDCHGSATVERMRQSDALIAFNVNYKGSNAPGSDNWEGG